MTESFKWRHETTILSIWLLFLQLIAYLVWYSHLDGWNFNYTKIYITEI